MILHILNLHLFCSFLGTIDCKEASALVKIETTALVKMEKFYILKVPKSKKGLFDEISRYKFQLKSSLSKTMKIEACEMVENLKKCILFLSEKYGDVLAFTFCWVHPFIRLSFGTFLVKRGFEAMMSTFQTKLEAAVAQNPTTEIINDAVIYITVSRKKMK